jgi:hypothetical protein
MFTTKRGSHLGDTIDEATKNMMIRLHKAYHQQAITGPTRNNWEGVILQRGKPVRDVSWNGTVSNLEPITMEEYNNLDSSKGEMGRCVHMNHQEFVFKFVKAG